MRKINLGNSSLLVPNIAIGCMRMKDLSRAEAESVIKTALEQGANFFDHADIYGDGTSEEIFADAINMNDDLREKLILQSKCGIRQGMFDSSKEHIITSVDAILKRLKTDYLDVLLIHRPDALVEPEEVATTFDRLAEVGKVKHFGVSNHNSLHIQLLQKYVKQPIIANQLQLSITNATMISSGINVNMENEAAINRDGSVLDFCRLNDITIQPWSPFQYGFFEGVFLGSEKYIKLNQKIDEIAANHGVSNTTIAIAWLLRHPANMQPVIGTMNPNRMIECFKATELHLTREEWYSIYQAAGNVLP